MQRSPVRCRKRLYLGRIILFTLCTAAMLCIVVFIPDSYAFAEDIRYVYDATGHGWTCLRTNEQMDVDFDAGVYPDGTQVAVLEKREGEPYDQVRYRVQIGRAVGWVFEGELLTEDEWMQKKESGQYRAFDSIWQVKPSLLPVEIYSHGKTEWFGTPMERQTIATMNEPSFVTLGLNDTFAHVRISDTDGFMSYGSCMIPNDLPDEVLNYTEPIWYGTAINAIQKAKGTNELNWTETERSLAYAFSVLDLNTSWTWDRVIEPSDCDISVFEAMMIAEIVLRSGDYHEYLSDDVLDLLEWDVVYYYLIHDYINPEKHIWVIYCSADPASGEDLATICYVQVDAHSKEILSITIDGPAGIMYTNDFSGQ